MSDEKVEDKPGKATGAKLTITVHYGKIDNDVEVLDTTTVQELRDAIRFCTWLTYNSAQLVVLTKDATGKLNPLGSNAMVADELGKDSKFEVWVEVLPDKASPPSPKELLSILASIECVNKKAEEVGWCLSDPVQTNTFQEAKASTELGQRAIKELKDNVREGTCRPLSFFVLGCAGIGKSRFCDEAQSIFFPSEPSVLIKVTYNVLGHSIYDRENPVEAFLWRIVAGIYGWCEPKFTAAHVPIFLDYMFAHRRPFGWSDVTHFAIECLSADHHWILAVDELTKLTAASPRQFAQILAFCLNWVRLSTEAGPLRCTVLTSCVPGLFEFLPGANRQPIYISPNLLPIGSCLDMATEYGLQPGDPLVIAAILMAGGHPRALYYALNYLKDTGSSMLVADLATKLNVPQFGPEILLELISHSFHGPRGIKKFPEALQELARAGSIRFAPYSSVFGYMSSPVPLIMAAIYHSQKQTIPPFSHLWSLSLSTGPDAPKRFEECVHRFELVKSALGLPVVPEMLQVILPPVPAREELQSKQQRVEPWQVESWRWQKLKYDFIEERDDNVLQPMPNGDAVVREDFAPKLDERWAVYCSHNHPYFEAMYEAKFPEGKRVKVLLQAKINDSLLEAVANLEKAATLLKSAGWNGLFLFVIVLGESKDVIPQCAHPLVLVKREDYATYFTQTLEPLLEAQRMIHQAGRR